MAVSNKRTANSIGELIEKLSGLDERFIPLFIKKSTPLANQTVSKLNDAAGVNIKTGKVYFKWILDPNHSEQVCDEFNTCEVNANADIGFGIGVYAENSLPEKVPPVHLGCTSYDTEVYTDEGWKYFYDLKGYEKIYALNPETLEADYVDYVDYIAYHYKGDMVRFNHKYMDFIVTPDHNKFILRRKRSWRNGNNGKFIGYKSQLITADDLGKDFKEYQFYKSQEYNDGKNYVELFGRKLDGKLFAKFMGYYLSEGSVVKRGNHYQITIAQSNNDNRYIIYQDVNKLFESSNNSQCIYIKVNNDLAEYLIKFGHSHQKYIPIEIKQLNKECLEAFVSAYVLGAGNKQKGNNYRGCKFTDSRHIYTSSKQMVDDFTEIFLKLGKSISYNLTARKGDKCVIRGKEYTLNHDVFAINELKKQTYHSAHITKSYIPYDDMVYGVTLEKWHVLLIRRKGKITWSGNCKCQLDTITSERQEEVGWQLTISDKGFVFSTQSEDIERQLTGSAPQVKDDVVTDIGEDPTDYVTPILNEFTDKLSEIAEKVLSHLFSSMDKR